MRRAVLLVALIALGCGNDSDPAGTVAVDPNDPEMGAAIAEARRTLPTFFERLASPMPGDDYFSLKVAMDADNGGKEHIWVADVVRTDGSLQGRLDNEPERLSGMKIGDTVTFDESQVSDWMIMQKDGSFLGGYTAKLLMEREGSD